MQRVRIGQGVSNWQEIQAGLPQGSVLGPLLFIIYTHDLPLHIAPPVICIMFADDTALCSIAASAEKSIQCLQKATKSAGV